MKEGAETSASDVAGDALVVEDGGRISASTIDGRGGSVTLRSDRILIGGTGSVSAATTGTGQGGDIALTARSIDLRNGGTVSASATGAGDAGRLTLTGRVSSSARPTAGIDASSRSGIDGEVLIDSPNEITGSVLPLETPAPASDAPEIRPCVPRLADERSTLTIESRMAPAAGGSDEFLPSPETAVGSEGRGAASLSATPCPGG